VFPRQWGQFVRERLIEFTRSDIATKTVREMIAPRAQHGDYDNSALDRNFLIWLQASVKETSAQ